jgi:hypothetical protein
VGPTVSRADRSNTELDTLVQKALRQALLERKEASIAPANEAAPQAKDLIKAHHLAGYYLQVTVEAPRYEGDKLIVSIRLTMYSYPGRALQGEFTPKLTQTGTPTRDVAAEDSLIQMAITRAVASFLRVAETTKP